VVRPSDLPDQLTAARGTLAQAQAQAALAQANKERTDRLAPTGFVSQAEQDQVQSTLATSEANLAAARANVDALATRLGEMRIESPLTGVVSLRRLDPGALVGPTAGSGSIVTVQRLDVLPSIHQKPALCRVSSYSGPGLPRPTSKRIMPGILEPVRGRPPRPGLGSQK